LNSDAQTDATHPYLIPLALVGRVPVKVSVENGAIQVGDYLTASATRPGYAMKATQAGTAIGMALEATSNNGKILVFVNPTYFVPQVASVLQDTNHDTTQLGNDLADLNITDASAFGNLVVMGQLYVQSDLTVKGIIHSAEIQTDKLTTKQLCVEDICVTRDQFLHMVQQAGGSSNTGSTQGPSDPTPPPSTDQTPAASDPTPPATDANIPVDSPPTVQ
jgi:hypothetical protein